MLFAPKDIGREQNNFLERLKSLRKFTKIPTPPPGRDSTEHALTDFFRDSKMWSRVIIVADTKQHLNKDRLQIHLPEPGFVFIQGFRGGNKSVDEIKKLSEEMKGKIGTAVGKNGAQILKVEKLADLPVDVFQREVITQEERPVTHNFLLEELGEEVLPKPFSFDGIKAESIFFGNSR